MLKLISEKGRFALRDNSMIFSNVVYLIEMDDTRLYHLIQDDSLDEIDHYVEKYLVKE
jgi:hypothetical protein